MGGFTEMAALTALQSGLGLVQAGRQARTQNAAAEAAAQYQIEQARRQQDVRERERRERLRRVLARQRAEFGANGVGAGAGGSAEAVLDGFVNETERTIQDERDLLSMSVDALNRRTEERRRRNLLELADFRRRSAFGAVQRGLSGLTSLLEP
jgi:NAD(P)H-hydrate repair Nnr-like enzyme with NAD(P)H-hydrate dehydratase domain